MDGGEIAAICGTATACITAGFGYWVARLKYYTNWTKTMDTRLEAAFRDIKELGVVLRAQQEETEHQRERAHVAELQAQSLRDQLAVCCRDLEKARGKDE